MSRPRAGFEYAKGGIHDVEWGTFERLFASFPDFKSASRPASPAVRGRKPTYLFGGPTYRTEHPAYRIDPPTYSWRHPTYFFLIKKLNNFTSLL